MFTTFKKRPFYAYSSFEGYTTNKKKMVLVIDDDADILRLFQRILEKANFKVVTAETGKEALKKIGKGRFDLYLIDVKLPDMDGTDLLQRLPREPRAVKIIVTGFSSEKVGKKAADYGADDFLVKPVKPEELLATVKERLNVIQPEDWGVSKQECYYSEK